MGYRSDVAISIYKKDFDELCRQISEKGVNSNLWSLLTYADIDIDGDEDNPESIVTMIWSDVKWYDGFDDVDFIMHFIRSEDRKYAYKRIGEDCDDCEQESNDDNWELSQVVYIDRSFGRDSYGRSVKAEKFLDGAQGESVDAGMKFDDVIGG